MATTTTTREAPPRAVGELARVPVNVRLKISALWSAMLFVFVYVDLFSLYRADVRADIEAGTLGGFEIGGPFLLGVTAYIAIAAVMVFASLVLPARLARIANIALPVVYALTIVGGAVGEWGYYLLGSALEVAALGAIVAYAVRWPRADGAAA